MAVESGMLAGVKVPETDVDAAVLRRMLDRGVQIPPQTRIVQDLARQLSASEVNLQVVAATLRRDPGLVAGLYRLARSGAYIQHGHLGTVEEILLAIGVRRAFNLVRALALYRTLDSGKNRTLYERFWSRSQVIAELAMIIASDRQAVCGVCPDEAYLAGLFQDCGVPILMQRFSTYCTTMNLADAGAWPDCRDEDQRLNTDHAIVGYFVARHWKLPDAVCHAVRYHHRFGEAGDRAAHSISAVLNLASHLWHRYRNTFDPAWGHVSVTTLEELCIREDGLPEYRDDVLERFYRA